MPFLNASQANREVSVHCALNDDVLLFQEMEGEEQLGRLFEYCVKLLSVRGDIRFDDVLGKGMAVCVNLHDDHKRYFHGVVTRFSRKGKDGNMFLYEAVLRPGLWLLTRSFDCLMFTDNTKKKTSLDILDEVVRRPEYKGHIALRIETKRTLREREYCVQYRESDFDFVGRLLEDDGLYYYFEHEKNAHIMVVVDNADATPAASVYKAVSFQPRARRPGEPECISSWIPIGQIEASSVTLDDFDFKNASASTTGSLRAIGIAQLPFGLPDFSQYDYPGGHDTGHDAGQHARNWSEALRGQSEQFQGVTDARGLLTGARFKLTDHDVEALNQEMLIIQSSISLKGQDFESGAGAGAAITFANTFIAVTTRDNYRPMRFHHKPIVHGPQTAMVVGGNGDETGGICTDEYGRIMVVFHWSRPHGDTFIGSACWVRVAQSWSGNQWGTMFIPRVGMEVVVEFLEGDPDRPLVTGCVYNADSMPPYKLPQHESRSTIKSSSTDRGGGFNEIRFEDKAGNEEVFIQAERDFNRIVKNNDTLKVGFEKKDEGDQSIAIHHDQSLDVGNDRKVHVVHNQSAEIDNDMSTKVGNAQSLDIGAGQHIKVGTTCVIEAGTSIELKVGASSIKIEPAKITIKSVEIAIQADAMMAIKAGAVMTVEGAMVKIN